MTSVTFNSIAAILQNDFHLERSTVQSELSLAELGLDSLALMEFVIAVEDAFHVRIPADRLSPHKSGVTLQGLCEVLEGIDAAPAADLAHRA